METIETAGNADMEALQIAPLSVADIDGGLQLTALAGWNQCGRDWQLMLRFGTGLGIRAGEQLVASAVALPYPPDFGWISMVLVHPQWRRQGLATRLLEAAIAELSDGNLTPMLDATPAGANVYRPLGFQDVERISRWRGAGRRRGREVPTSTVDLTRIGALDLAAFGADRGAVLANLAARPDCVFRACLADAFLLSRAGRTATQIGPIVASDEDDAVELLDWAIDTIEGPLLVDVPDRNHLMRRRLEDCGFAVERPFIRMAQGRNAGFGNGAHIRAIAGPELG
jgi:GNAT superfamily N-acetyltransferase